MNHHWYVIGPDGARGVDLTLSRVARDDHRRGRRRSWRPTRARRSARTAGATRSARLRDLWNDDTVVDVLYPTAGLSVLQMEDVELQEACCRAYNDWLIEFCATDPVRLLGLALLATNDMETRGRRARAHPRRRACAARSSGAAPPPGSSFFDADYEPLWAAAAARADADLAAHPRWPQAQHEHQVVQPEPRGHLLRGVRDAPGDPPVGVRAHRRRRVRASPRPARRRRGGRHRVRRQPRAQARLRLHVVLEEVQQPVDDAVGVLPPQRVPHVHQRPARPEQPALHRRRPLHVVGRLSAPGIGVARLARRDPARPRGDRRPRRRDAPQADASATRPACTTSTSTSSRARAR